MLMKLLMRHSA